MEEIKSKKSKARLAGVLYLVGGIAAAYGMLNPPWQTTAVIDNAAFAKKILDTEFIFRTKIFSSLLAAVIFLLLVFVLFRLFRNVSEEKAKLVIAFTIVQVPIVFVLEVFRITALMILKGEMMKSLDAEKAQDLAILFIKNYQYGVLVLAIFWGLWLIPFGQLALQSGFIPRIIGVFLILGGIAYVIESSTVLLLPDYKIFVNRITPIFYSLAELSTILWLLIFGVKEQKQQT